MSIQITEAELWTWNTLNGSVANAQAELQRLATARDDYLHKLESAYNAKFDLATGNLIPISKQKKQSKGKEAKSEVAT